MRNRQVTCVLRLVRDLAATRFGLTAADLLRQYAGARRTFFRDLAAIEAAGFVLDRETRMDGRVAYRIRGGFPCGSRAHGE